MSEGEPPLDDVDRPDFAADSGERSGSVGTHDLLVGVALVWGTELAMGTMAAGWVHAGAAAAVPGIVLVLTLASNVVTLLVAWWLVCRKYQKTCTEGFALEGVPAWSVITWGVFGIITAAGATVLIASYANDKGVMADMGKTLQGLSAALVLAVIVPPFEEFYYRGFIQPALANGLNPAAAVAITSGWFAVAHTYQLVGNWVALLVVATMGLVWSLMRAKTKSLLPPLASHWCYNITIVIIQIAVL